MAKGTMAKKSAATMVVYSFLSMAEGGPCRAGILYSLLKNGIEARATRSVYVGHVAVAVTGGKRAHRKAERVIYG